MDGQQMYEQHREDCAGWGLPAPPPWSELSPAKQIGWNESADEHTQKRLNDLMDVPA